MRILTGYELVMKVREVGDKRYGFSRRFSAYTITPEFRESVRSYFYKNRIEKKGVWVEFFKEGVMLSFSEPTHKVLLDLLAELRRFHGFTGEVYENDEVVEIG